MKMEGKKKTRVSVSRNYHLHARNKNQIRLTQNTRFVLEYLSHEATFFLEHKKGEPNVTACYDLPLYDSFCHMMLVELLADSSESSSSSTESPSESS